MYTVEIKVNNRTIARIDAQNIGALPEVNGHFNDHGPHAYRTEVRQYDVPGDGEVTNQLFTIVHQRQEQHWELLQTIIEELRERMHIDQENGGAWTP